MSLTRHLESLTSPVRQFIYASAPDLARAGTRGTEGKAMASAFALDELTALATQIPIPDEVKPALRKGHATLAGMALDYRIRMDLPGFSFSDAVAQKGLERIGRDVTVLYRGKHIQKLLHDALGFAYLTHQEPDSHSCACPDSLLRVAQPMGFKTSEL